VLALNLFKNTPKNAKVSCEEEGCGFPEECFKEKPRMKAEKG
jgi:hypothetical protein